MRGFIETDFLPPHEIPMPIDRRRFLQVVAILGALCAYATIIVGGTVRGMGAGLACPDWPLCNGSVVPDLADTGIFVEYVHRLVAALTGMFRAPVRNVNPVARTSAVPAGVTFGPTPNSAPSRVLTPTIQLRLGSTTL